MDLAGIVHEVYVYLELHFPYQKVKITSYLSVCDCTMSGQVIYLRIL